MRVKTLCATILLGVSLIAGAATAEQKEILKLVNKERATKGLKPVKLNEKLNQVATAKSQDMKKKKYFSHTSPTYGSPFDMMNKAGLSYKTAGENIAMGQQNPDHVMKSWMNSKGHKKNILNPKYTEMGIGVVNGATGPIWTQMFMGS